MQGEALKEYYRNKAAQWAIYCWDKGERSDAVLRTAMPNMADTRRAFVAEQRAYVKNFGERVIGYGHFLSDDGCDTLGTSFFMQLDDLAAAKKFIDEEPLSKAGVYDRVEINRWSNSFGKRAADYRRKGMQQFLCTGPKTNTNEFYRAHLHAHESYFASYGDSFIFRGRSARPTAPTTSAPRCCSNSRPRRGGQVLERGAVFQERRLSARRADRALGVRRLRLRTMSSVAGLSEASPPFHQRNRRVGSALPPPP